MLYTEGGPVETKTSARSDGLSITQVNRTAAATGINVKISGNTLVNSELTSYGQSIAKGESVDYGTTVSILQIEYRRFRFSGLIKEIFNETFRIVPGS